MSARAPVMRDVAEVVEPELLSRSVSYRIRLLQIASYKIFEQRVEGFGSAPRYFGMLKLIEANPGIPQTRLAEAIFLDRSSLVPILEGLTREGWVERKSTPQDKRVRRVFLTETGRERLGQLEQLVAEHEAAITEGLSDAEREQLISSLERVGENLRSVSAGPK
ncbi:MarR family winged helix-turn-helix transcriptional regulator [Vannielia litorea]|uniref:MarR family winged helix-turn-helix transcriptional regulator n=1 Tax=Vannielia litorea TaxID=1217970 RepID=UPI001C946F67|nr:MarR family transcriptional regulator [Vannielia litorea]MBY6048746.1 MarR family transcriptional regulator [Vannielia litorea]MBY6076160.1 MarR family transcriptional regulator [Vannielia litorea]